MPAPEPASACACGSGASYSRCCELLHLGAPAHSAVALMRSRYCAYVLHNEDYLLASWHPSTRPAELTLTGDPTRWLGLTVRDSREDRAAGTAEVEFIARYRVGGGRAERLHERSRFVFEHGRWYYLDGEQ